MLFRFLNHFQSHCFRISFHGTKICTILGIGWRKNMSGQGCRITLPQSHGGQIVYFISFFSIVKLKKNISRYDFNKMQNRDNIFDIFFVATLRCNMIIIESNLTLNLQLLSTLCMSHFKAWVLRSVLQPRALIWKGCVFLVHVFAFVAHLKPTSVNSCT